MLAEKYYPHMFIDMSHGEEIDEEKIKEWITFVEKTQFGISISSGKYLVIKNKNGDIIVSDSYRVLPKEILEDLNKEEEHLSKQVEDFLEG